MYLPLHKTVFSGGGADPNAMMVLRILVISTAALNMLVEISQMVRMKVWRCNKFGTIYKTAYLQIRYFRSWTGLRNAVDWGLYSLSILFVFNPKLAVPTTAYTESCEGDLVRNQYRLL